MAPKAFKPPRQISAPTKSPNTSTSKSSKVTKATKPTKSTKSRASPPPKPRSRKSAPAKSPSPPTSPETIPSSPSDQPDPFATQASAPSQLPPPPPPASQPKRAEIPPRLLTAILHEMMGDKMRISKRADAALHMYMDVFVREAIARAKWERENVGVEGAGGGGFGGEFLEVEDLEKLAPQLVLDF